MRQIIFLFLFLLNINAYGQVESFLYKTHINKDISPIDMPYRLCLPKNYDNSKSYPLVMFLHGAGERGTNNTAQLTANRGATLWAETANQEVNPCFVIAPQCYSNRQWVNTAWGYGSYEQENVAVSDELLMAMDILDSLGLDYNIDTKKLYITGLSMGGYGTFDAITRFPGKFAAAIPMCGAGDPSKAFHIGNMPLWIFHSADDPVVPVAGSRDMVKAINELGPNDRSVLYKEYTNQNHSVWIAALNEPGLNDWLFSSSPVNIIPGGFCNITTLGGDVTGEFEDSQESIGMNMAFDNLKNTYTYIPQIEAWIQFNCKDDVEYKLSSYSITSSSGQASRDPISIVLKGLDDGYNWVTLDSISDLLFQSRLETKEYNVEANFSFSKFRIKMKAAPGSSIQLAEIELMGIKKNAALHINDSESGEGRSFRVYPNPAEKELNISFLNSQNRSLLIADIFGRVLKKTETSEAQIQVEVENFESGIYFLIVKTINGQVTRSFVIQ